MAANGPETYGWRVGRLEHKVDSLDTTKADQSDFDELKLEMRAVTSALNRVFGGIVLAAVAFAFAAFNNFGG